MRFQLGCPMQNISLNVLKNGIVYSMYIVQCTVCTVHVVCIGGAGVRGVNKMVEKTRDTLKKRTTIK